MPAPSRTARRRVRTVRIGTRRRVPRPLPPRLRATRRPLPTPIRARPTPPPRDPYYQNAPSDPYAPRSQNNYEADWNRAAYPDNNGHQFQNYYPPMDEPPLDADAQSVHDRFFAPEGQPEEAAPPAASLSERFRAFEEDDFDADAGQSQGFSGQAAAAVYNEPAQRHTGATAPQHYQADDYNGNFAEGDHYGWENGYDQTPAPANLRPIQPPAIRDEDLDADFFADEDDYDHEDYEPDHRGGRKKLVAAVLIGAVVAGGGLAYVYKSTNTTGGGEGPSVIAADTRPIKEEPTDPGGRDFANRDKLIYDRLPGSDNGGSPQLASGESGSAPQQNASADIPGIVTTGTLEERIENALKAQGGDGKAAQAPAATEEPNSPELAARGPHRDLRPRRHGAGRTAAGPAHRRRQRE